MTDIKTAIHYCIIAIHYLLIAIYYFLITIYYYTIAPLISAGSSEIWSRRSLISDKIKRATYYCIIAIYY